MKNLNPYAPPAAAHESREAPYARFVSCGYLATIAGACFVLVILAATRSGLWTAAAAFLSLELHFLQAGIIAWLTQTLSWPERDAPMDHRKMSMPEPRKQSRHCSATAAGHTLPQVLGAVAIVAGAVLTVPTLYFILITIMGAQEPRW